MLRIAWGLTTGIEVWACGMAESSENDSGPPEATGGRQDEPAASGGRGTGGEWTESGIDGCFSTFGIDPALQIADLSDQQVRALCEAQEEMFYCVHPKGRMCTYSAAIATLNNENPVERCREFEAECLSGQSHLPVVFECKIPLLNGCPGAVGDLEACFLDYVIGISERPSVEWTCENGTEVIKWTLDNAIDLPESCAPYDGCAL